MVGGLEVMSFLYVISLHNL